MVLSNLKPNRGANRPAKKIGRGNGSGHGRTSCRGSNGANSRAGATHYARFEGGQMPLQRRLPKRGFRNHFSVNLTPVNIGDVSTFLGDATLVDIDFLTKVGLVKSSSEIVKILGSGDITKPVTWKGFVISKAASEKILKSGGKIEDARITEVKIIEKPVKIEKPEQAPKIEKDEAVAKAEKPAKAPKMPKPEKADKPANPGKKKGAEA